MAAPRATPTVHFNALRSRHRLRRHRGFPYSPLLRTASWSNIPIAGLAQPAATASDPPRYAATWTLIGVVLLAHALFGWYALHRPARTAVPLASPEVAVELERPKPPEPQKLEPPKPPPPQKQPQPAPTLPPIAQAAPESSDPSTPTATEPAVAVPPDAAPAAPAPVTAAFGRAGYLNNPAPEYPAVATRLGWEGTVILRVRVRSNGTVESLEVQTSSGRKPLDDAALQTVKRWLFTPSRRGDTPVDGWATVPIEFKLDQ